MEKELTKEQKQEILDRIGAKAEPVEKIFDSLRDMTMGILEVNNKMLSTIADLESENKLLREENLRLQNRISSLENICEMDRKTEYQYNQLYKEKEALLEEITKCKDLAWEAANEISRLNKEIDRLKKQRNEAQALLNQYAKPGQTFGFSNLDV